MALPGINNLRAVNIVISPTPAASTTLSQRFAIGLHGIVQKSSLGAPNFEVVDRNFGMEAQTSHLQVSCALPGPAAWQPRRCDEHAPTGRPHTTDLEEE